MTEAKLVSRTASASLALSGANLFSKIIDFLLIMLLARLLTPEDFALIAIAMIFVQVTEAVLQIPVGQALIMSKRVTRDMLYTGFSISVIRSVIVVAIILALTPIAAAIFSEPRLYLLMPILAFAPAFRGMCNPKMQLFARRLNYFPDAIIAIVARAITVTIAIPFAIITESYWSLVVMTVVTPMLLALATYVYVPFMPRWSLKSWSVFSNMVGWSTISQFFSAAHWQANVFVIAQFSSRVTTGNYSVGANLNSIIQISIIGPLLIPFVSTFSILNRGERLQDGYLMATRAILMCAGPLLIVMATLSQPIIFFLFGADWQEAPVFLTFLSVSSLITVAFRPAGSVAYAKDQTVYFAIHSAVVFFFGVSLLFLGFYFFGLNGFFVAQIAGSVVYLMSSLWMVKRLIAVPYTKQLHVLLTPAIALVVMAVSCSFFIPIVQYSSFWMLFIGLASASTLGLVAFVLTVVLIWVVRGRPSGIERTVWEALSRVILKNKASLAAE